MKNTLIWIVAIISVLAIVYFAFMWLAKPEQQTKFNLKWNKEGDKTAKGETQVGDSKPKLSDLLKKRKSLLTKEELEKIGDAQYPTGDRELKYIKDAHLKGADVQDLQKLLNDISVLTAYKTKTKPFILSEDGDFGESTAKAVKIILGQDATFNANAISKLQLLLSDLKLAQASDANNLTLS